MQPKNINFFIENSFLKKVKIRIDYWFVGVNINKKQIFLLIGCLFLYIWILLVKKIDYLVEGNLYDDISDIKKYFCL